MSTGRGDLERVCCESLLLLRLGWKMQRTLPNVSEGIPHHLLAHGGGRLLLDWSYLGRIREYEYIHPFVSKWTPYRYGGVLAQAKNAARESNQHRPPLHRWFYKDLAEKDVLFRKLGVRVVHRSDGTGISAIQFPPVEPALWAAVCDSYELKVIDKELVDGLVDIYSTLYSTKSARDLTAAASCSNEELTKASIAAEFHLVHWEYSRVLSALFEPDALSTPGIRERIIESSKRANACSMEIFEKVSLAGRIAHIRDSKIPNDSLAMRIKPTLRDQHAAMFEREARGGNLLRSFAFFSSAVLVSTGFTDIVLPETIEREFDEAVRVLRESGTESSVLNHAISLSSSITANKTSDLAAVLSEVYSIVKEQLREWNLPSEFARGYWDSHVTCLT